MTREQNLILSAKEKKRVEQAASLLGISFEEACSRLFSEGLARRSKKRVGKKPSSVKKIN